MNFLHMRITLLISPRLLIQIDHIIIEVILEISTNSLVFESLYYFLLNIFLNPYSEIDLTNFLKKLNKMHMPTL